MSNVLFDAQALIVGRLKHPTTGFNARYKAICLANNVPYAAVDWSEAAGQFYQANVTIDMIEAQNPRMGMKFVLFNASAQVNNRTTSQVFSGVLNFVLQVHVPFAKTQIGGNTERQMNCVRSAVILTFNHRDVWTWAEPFAYNNTLSFQTQPMTVGDQNFRQSILFNLALQADQHAS